jgi:hypothetical protein
MGGYNPYSLFSKEDGIEVGVRDSLVTVFFV